MRHYIFTSPLVRDRPPNDHECDSTGNVWWSTLYTNGSVHMTFNRPSVVRYHWKEGLAWTIDRPQVCLGDYVQSGFDWKINKYCPDATQQTCNMCGNEITMHASQRS